VIPGLVYAHRFFGDSLPPGLKGKLRNQSQTQDTLFELLCLGAFHPHHVLKYEPKLADGKVPDLVLSLATGQAVYIECKSQRPLDSKHQRLFIKVTARLHKILDLDRSGFVNKAWVEGLRSEIHLLHAPSEFDIRELEQRLDEYAPRLGMPAIAFGNSITLSLASRDEPFDKTQPPPSAVIRLGTEPGMIHHTNAHTAIYPWPGLDAIRRRSQRRLLTDARRQLRSIPLSAYGLVCMQVLSSNRFVPDIHSLLRQKEFERIPMVWVNPTGGGQIICRNDALFLRDQVFGAMFDKFR